MDQSRSILDQVRVSHRTKNNGPSDARTKRFVDPWAKDEPPCCKLGSCGIINRFCFKSNGTSALYNANNVENSVTIKDFSKFKSF